MDLISTGDILGASTLLKRFGGEPAARAILKLLQFGKINDFYSAHHQLSGDEFLDRLIEATGVKVTISPGELEKIPKTGSFITVSNHAYGGIDGILLAQIMSARNPGYKLLVNFLLTKIRPLQPWFLGVNPFESHREASSSFGGLKEAFSHLQNGYPLGIFPAGEVSSYKFDQNAVTDREWQFTMLKFIKRAKVPVVPVYFTGHNTLLFNLLGMIHPMLRTVRLPAELFNKQGREITIRIGSPVTVREQDEFMEIREYGKFLRMKTYSLALPPGGASRNRKSVQCRTAPIISPIAPSLIAQEIAAIMDDHLLFALQENFVFCVPSAKIPNILDEICRLREVTYREVGEGTGNPLDRDRYDEYFDQLFIWDNEAKRITGGYRIGKGDRILGKYGIEGHYINSLFKIGKPFEKVLRVSMELGRSFIVKDYQKKPLSLFLLWKGILYHLLKSPGYRYLIGPVSISNEFGELSKSLVVEYLKANCYNSEYGACIKAHKPFRSRLPGMADPDMFLRFVSRDIGRLDKFINDIDPGFKLPVLLKKYLSVNAEVLGFNVDPLFNNCLDALIILDLFEVPVDMIESLSKEINDQSLLERFRKGS
ncbi:MAG: GNAT family N-acyltransferase [Bacteroidota bacterium]